MLLTGSLEKKKSGQALSADPVMKAAYAELDTQQKKREMRSAWAKERAYIISNVCFSRDLFKLVLLITVITMIRQR